MDKRVTHTAASSFEWIAVFEPHDPKRKSLWGRERK